MNSLSWMIYAAEALGNAKALFIVSAIISGIAVAFAVLFTGIGSMDGDDGFKAGFAASLRKLWIPFVLAATAVFLPSTSTIYMIAASEAGEAVVSTPEAKEMLGDLKEIIRRKLKEQLKEEVGI